MVTPNERAFVRLMIRLRLFELRQSMRLPWVRPRPGAGWVLEWLLRRQAVDDLHHAPCCPANHYHRRRLVFQPCTCGAALHAAGGDQ